MKAYQAPLEYPVFPNYAGKKVFVGVSGGINSAAALCWLAQAPGSRKPAELHLFYAHLEEHSPGTLEFSRACAEYAKQHFPVVYYTETQASVLEFFEGKKMIPHPTFAPCTAVLKLEPMYAYMAEHQITENVVAYVQEEQRRINRMATYGEKTSEGVLLPSGVEARFPIKHFENEWCFHIVVREIGWYPAIYDIRDEQGNRVFKHNNCLPCKNMRPHQLAAVQQHFPAYFANAQALSERLQKHWGRDADEYYTQFGRPEYAAGVDQPCAICAAD